MPKIHLGFVSPEPEDAKPEPWRLHRAYFKSKIGGFPAWLNPDNTPTVKCDNCQSAMVLLVQIYCPMEQAFSYHRVLYVFMCRDEECHLEYKVDIDIDKVVADVESTGLSETNVPSPKNHMEPHKTQTKLKLPYKVFRCQLPQINLFYLPTPTPNYDSDKRISELADRKLASDFCFNCGQTAKNRCKNCKAVAYCNKNCQTIHWKTMHKKVCKKCDDDKAATGNKNFIYPTSQSAWSYKENEVVCEPEPKLKDLKDKNSKHGAASEKELLEKFHKNSEFTDQEVDETVDSKTYKIDKTFVKFVQRLNREPEQILRYLSNFEEKLELVVNYETQKLDEEAKHISKCKFCGGPRCLEMQITPQILNYIKPDENPLKKVGGNSKKNTARSRNRNNSVNLAKTKENIDKYIDFGLLNIYTCEDNCKFSENYSEEVITRHYPSDKNTVYARNSDDSETESESESESEVEGSDESGSTDFEG